jgi:ABC-type uncharacterized transport system substrate-binding protein
MDRVRTGRPTKTGWALAAMLAVGASPASAHPHVWITVESVVIYERGSITAIQHTWTFDELYTTMAIQGLDTNNDGNYDRKELAELAKVNMDGLKEFAYFTQASLANQAIGTDDPKDYYLEYAEATAQGESEPSPQPSAPSAGSDSKSGIAGRVQNWLSGDSKKKPAAKPKVLSLHFTLPLKQPVLAEAPGFSFTVSDPTFFIAFELAKGDPVKLGAGAPPACRVAIGGAERDAQDAKRLSEAFATQMGAQGFGLGFAKPIAITCEPKS